MQLQKYCVNYFSFKLYVTKARGKFLFAKENFIYIYNYMYITLYIYIYIKRIHNINYHIIIL